FTVILSEPSALAVNGSVSNVTCSGGNNGVINLSVSGGTPAYSLKWSNNVETEDNFNLSAGTYNVKVTDKNGCSVSNSYTINQPASPLIVNGTAVNSTATKKGSVDITITGGAGGYTFLWSNGAKTEDVADLIPGVYTVVVTDANGCAASSTFVIGGTVGISNLNNLENDVTIYPNPAVNNAFIEMDGYNMEKLQVCNSIGQIVLNESPMSSKYEINTTDLNDGVYFVKVYVREQWITKKLRVTK
nr:T9SS type A sorting domain-containing protein [Chitinophagales bacterium]